MDKLKYVRKLMVNITETIKPYGVSARVQHIISGDVYQGLTVGLYRKGHRIGTIGIVDVEHVPTIKVLVTEGSPTVNADANMLSFNVAPHHAHGAFDEFTSKHIANWIGADHD